MDISENTQPAAGGRIALIPALVCAVLSVGLMRSGIVSFFFLVPLGFGALAYNRAGAWFSFASAAILNVAVSLVFALSYRVSPAGAWLDILYYTVMTFGFTWICTGVFPAKTEGFGKPLFRIRTAYRFILASLAGSLCFLLIGYATRNSSGLSAVIRSQAEALSSLYISSSGTDAARRSFLEHVLTPDNIVEFMRIIALRGAALVSCFFMFFISRQISLSLVRILRRRRPAEAQSLWKFHVPPYTIWVLSISLALILLSNLAKAEIAEIAAWNILVICVILFLAQGGGIALYNFKYRPIPPLGRMIINVLIIIMIFSPGINALALGMLVLLGIAENWLPLRAPVKDGPASTPRP
ncbi:MAG: hypothetical protein LBS57_03515 [Treponema sp.]|jgi:hypothetical protein|nr:hypothetical protein [Treponema sp.]